MCQTFNGYPLDQILKPSEWLQEYSSVFERESEEVDIRKNFGLGEENGFVFVVDLMFEDKIQRNYEGKGMLFS